MAPSSDPEDYSRVSNPLLGLLHCQGQRSPQWCSLCTDYGSLMILCVSCRVGICSTTPEFGSGCLEWQPIIDLDDFIFYCPYCAKADKKACLVSVSQISNKS